MNDTTRKRMNSIILGRNHRMSHWIVFTALISTIAIGGIVAVTTVSYAPTGLTSGERIVLNAPSYTLVWEWFIATYNGNSHPFFTIGASVLLLGAAGSSYLNSGLLPTAGIVMGPIFGVFVNRVGNPVLVASDQSGLSYAPMPLSDAIVWGMESAVIFGSPIVISGFILGVILRIIIPPKRIIAVSN